MASLLDTIKQNGQITTNAKKRPATPIDQLSQNSGMTVPTDQMSATLLGANPDQVKMVGGAPQMRNAIQKNSEPAKDQATQQREAQPRRAGTTDEQAQIDEQKRLANLGTLDSRVQNLAQQKLDLQNQTLALDIDTTKLPGYATMAPADQTKLKDLALKVNDGSATPDDTAELNRLLGRDINSVLTKEEISGFLKSGEQLAAEQAARETQDNITLEDIQPQELGYSSYADLASDLGLDPNTINTMTINQLVEAVQAKQRNDYSSADRWRQVLADPTSSVNDRAEAARVLREMGAVGVRQSDDNMEKLSADIDASNTVEFGGEQYTIKELLSDETIAGIAKNYFNDPDAAERVRKENPGLAAFFDQHTELLEKASQNVSSEVGDLDKILTQKKGVIDELKGIFGSDGYSAMFSGLDAVNTEVPTLPKFIQEKSKFSGSELVGVGTMIGDLNKLSPQFSDKLINMSYDDLKSLGLTTQAGRDDFMTYAQLQNTLNQPAASVDPDNVISQMFGDETALQSNLRSLKAMTGSTDPILDANNDGIMDDTQTILSRLQNKYSGQDLLGGFKQNNPTTQATTLAQTINQYKTPGSPENALFNAYSDGNLSAQEVSDIGNHFSAGNDLKSLKTLSNKNSTFSDYWAMSSMNAANTDLQTATGKTLGELQQSGWDDPRGAVDAITNTLGRLRDTMDPRATKTLEDILKQFTDIMTGNYTLPGGAYDYSNMAPAIPGGIKTNR